MPDFRPFYTVVLYETILNSHILVCRIMKRFFCIFFLLFSPSYLSSIAQVNPSKAIVTQENLLREIRMVFEQSLAQKFPGSQNYILSFINHIWDRKTATITPCSLERVDTARVAQINKVLFLPEVYRYYYFDHTLYTPDHRGPFRCNPDPLCSEGRTEYVPNFVLDRSTVTSSVYARDLYTIYKATGGFYPSMCFEYLRTAPEEALAQEEVREYFAVMLWGYICYYSGYDIIERAKMKPNVSAQTLRR